ncbi:MAG TPA: hypothetical protein VF451_05885 [Acidobacteriota bacterium]
MKMKVFALLCLSCLILAVPAAGTLLAAKYPPGQRWREIGRGGFTVIFPATRFREAEAALAAAEGLRGKLADFWRAPLPARTRIVLDDSTDLANGFTTVIPFNLVGVNLAEPPPDSELAASRGWLDLVLAHELTHLFTLDAANEFGRTLRRVFGTLPILYSTAQMPPWALEGLAVYGESRFSLDGRLDHAPYRLMLAAARRDGLFPDWSRIDGLPAAWPGPSAKYLFGAGFMEFLAEKYGADRLRLYLDRVAARLVLISSSRDFANTFSAPLGKLWNEYRDLAPRADSAESTAPRPLTREGFSHQYPCPLGKDGLVFFSRDYRERGAISILNLASGRERTLLKMDAVNGLSFAAPENKVYFSAAEQFHAFSEFSDLYAYDMTRGRRQRLSRGQRLSQPVKRENAPGIYCVQRRDGKYRLAVFDAQKAEARPLSRPFAGVAQPDISPDGSMVAASVKPEGGPWGIGLFSLAGEERAFITMPGADLSQPRWHGDRKLFFIQAGAETTSLVSFSLAGEGGGVCQDPRLSGLRQFSFSADGADVFFTCFSGRGQEIARLGLEGLPFSPQELTVAQAIPGATAATPPLASRPYRPWRDLLPRWWSPALRSGGDEVQAGIMTGGQDALDIHRYSLEGYYGFSSRRANFLFSYAYDGLFPTLSLSYKDSIDYFRGSRSMERSQEVKLASLWPLRIRKRSQLYAYADMHLERRSYIDEDYSFIYPGGFNGFRLGLSFNSTREYYDSVSPADGVLLTVQGFIHPEGLGNKWANRGLQADLRGYIPLSRPGVLAWRLAAARSWDAGTYYYEMGGFTAESGLGNDQPFKLLRGFPAGFQAGDRGWQFNLEYRTPLFKIEKAVVPAFSLDRVYMNAFFDMGRLANKYHPDPIAYSVGGEAVLRLAFGGTAATDLALGVAHGFGARQDLWIYLRMGRSF